MPKYIENDNVYFEGDGIKMAIGSVNKIETIRIDNETVEDVLYTFDLELGEYVEQSRTTRVELLPPLPESESDKIASLEAENEALKDRVSFTEDAILTLMDLNMML